MSVQHDMETRCPKCGQDYSIHRGDEVECVCPAAADPAETLREALRQISLCSKNSASSKDECGRIARAALDAVPASSDAAAPPLSVSADAIVAEVCARHRIERSQVVSASRLRRFQRARREIAEALVARGLTLVEIGAVLGGRDHSTIHNLLGRRARRAGDTA